ncbi:putative CCDC77 protein [Paratrimastix pyriformis]|uniref:CCDC77 protein n=1 Tax=Paratrimastix pyriformis TaxID=342808 RepID=A0ABQ8UTF5_9EUKA|nr:putative CCDC77 protein [Paratrimastix pyriformis]
MAGLESLPLTPELLNHYRVLVEQFDHERAEWLSKFRECEVATDEYHGVQAENRKLKEEIYELQKALSDANMYLFDERKQHLKTLAENDALKLQEIEDRRRIQHLFELGGAGGGAAAAGGSSQAFSSTSISSATGVGAAGAAETHDITYFRDRPPEMVPPSRPLLQRGYSQGAPDPAPQVHSREGSTQLFETVRSGGGGRSPPRGANTPVKHPVDPSVTRVMQTVVLPSEERDSLLVTIQALRTQLEEQVALLEGQIAALEEDRRIRVEEATARARADRETIERAQQANATLQVRLQRLTQAYLTQERTSQAEQRAMVEHNEKLRSAPNLTDPHRPQTYINSAPTSQPHNPHQPHANSPTTCGPGGHGGRRWGRVEVDQLRRELDETRLQASLEAKAAIEAADKQSTAFVSRFREQVQEAEENLNMFKEKHQLTVAEYESEVTRLKKKCNELAHRYQELDRRRNLEVEGFSTDIAMLRRQVAAQEAKLLKMVAERRAAREKEADLLATGADLAAPAPAPARRPTPTRRATPGSTRR